jgi:NADPH:quinone reductase-like Zn-dependent oxidoreductase
MDDEALVEIKATAVNAIDHHVRLGEVSIAKAPPLILGNEGAGILREPGGSNLQSGTRVMFTGPYGVLRQGCWAEYVTVRPEDIAVIPPGLTDIEAAAVPVGFLTAYLALRTGDFQNGQVVLVPAVGGSVGNAAVQLASALGAKQVISTASSTMKAQLAEELGYESVIDLSQEQLRHGITRLTNGQGIDLVIDSIGGALTGQAVASLKRGGTVVIIGYMAGGQASIDLIDMIRKRSRLIGFHLWFEQPQAIAEAYEQVGRLLADERVKPRISRVFSLMEVQDAQCYLSEGRPLGKVVLDLQK